MVARETKILRGRRMRQTKKIRRVSTVDVMAHQKKSILIAFQIF